MANLTEVLFTCDTNNTLWTCSLWDPHTGTSLMHYKGGGTTGPRTLSIIGGDYLAAVEKTKPILHVWPLNSQQTVQGMRFVLPGKASAFSVSPDGNFCVAGIDEKVYLWQISSGKLLTIISRHYQQIVLLKFTPDGRYFISAAEDGMVMVWSLTTVAAHPEVELVTQSTAGQHDPVYVFSDHSLPITDLFISKMGMQGRLTTVSSDRTCKFYDLSSGEMLLNLIFDVPLLSVTLDVLELNAFVGTAEGKIHKFSLSNPPRNRDQYVNEGSSSIFSGHTKGVTCLSASLDGEILMSGSNDDQVILWHIPSRQPMRTLRHKGPITNAFFAINPKAVYTQDFSPRIILHSLDRTLEKGAEEITEIEVLTKTKSDFWPTVVEKSDELEKYTQGESVIQESKLKDEIHKLKKINSDLYNFSVKKIIDSVKPVPHVENGIKKNRKTKK